MALLLTNKVKYSIVICSLYFCWAKIVACNSYSFGPINHRAKEASMSASEQEDMARWYLERLRTGDDGAEAVREYLRKAGLAPTDIGTSDEELDRLGRQYNVTGAKGWVDRMRANPISGSEFVREQIAERGLTLEEAGTSEAELREADILHGKHLIASMADGSSSLKEVRSHLKQAGLKVSDLGKTWIEIKQLRRAGVVAEGKELVQKMRQKQQDPGYLIVHLKGRGYNLTPRDVGTTWAEIRRFTRTYALAEAKRLVSQMRGATYQGSEVRSRLKDLGITYKAAGTSRSELAAARWGPNDWIARLQTKK